jgi:hypothetical protein
MELKPRSASSGKFAGKIRHNQEPLFNDEWLQVVALTKTEDKEQQLLVIFNLLKIKQSTDRTATATPDKAKIEANIKALDAHMQKIEATTGKAYTKEQLKAIIEKCADKKMQEALSNHYFKVEVAPKAEEFVFAL